MEPWNRISPRSMTQARSLMPAAKAQFCSESRTATPSAFMARIASAIICTITGNTGTVAAPPNCDARRHDDFSGWSYTAGFDYKVTEDILAYIKTSKGFRSGGQNLRAGNLAAFVPFKPEVA